MISKTILFLAASVALVASLVFGAYYYYRYLPNHKVFTLKGDIVDESGTPLDTGVAVNEGNFVSITQLSSKTHLVPTPHGRFFIKTGPCFMVSLEFGLLGFREQHMSFATPGNGPIPLHIVLHKDLPKLANAEPTPVGLFEFNPREHEWGNMPYAFVRLALEKNGTATGITNLDGARTQMVSKGTWHLDENKEAPKIIVYLKNTADGPDPASISGKEMIFSLSQEGDRLIPWNDCLPFNRIGH